MAFNQASLIESNTLSSDALGVVSFIKRLYAILDFSACGLGFFVEWHTCFFCQLLQILTELGERVMSQ